MKVGIIGSGNLGYGLSNYLSNLGHIISISDKDTKKIETIGYQTYSDNVECRPLICGSINEHPFWYERYGKQELPISKRVHEYGLYLPNNHQMTIEEVDKVINIVNQYV